MVQNVKLHFKKRVSNYNQSSNWVSDPCLAEKIFDLANPKPENRVLDLACGTGLISKIFFKKVTHVTGVDISLDMVSCAKNSMDSFVLCSSEKLNFPNESFDIVVCRQGLQFMNLHRTLKEVKRVLKRNGVIVLCHLTAYNEDDKEETFHIQKLRNPARANFFMPDDFEKILTKYEFKNIILDYYLSRESINKWINHDAIDETSKHKIVSAYKGSSNSFKRIHNIDFTDNDIFDTMMMTLVRANKKDF